MQGGVSNSLSSDSLANMMLSSSVLLAIKKFITNNNCTEHELLTLEQGYSLLTSIRNGYAFMTPYPESGFNHENLSYDIDIFNDTASLFFKEKETVDIDKIKDYESTLSKILNQDPSLDKNKLNHLATFFENLTEQFFIRANCLK